MLKVGDKVIRKNLERDLTWLDFCARRDVDPKGVHTISAVNAISGYENIRLGGSYTTLMTERFLKVK